jgi:hypothetical protein
MSRLQASACSQTHFDSCVGSLLGSKIKNPSMSLSTSSLHRPHMTLHFVLFPAAVMPSFRASRSAWLLT